MTSTNPAEHHRIREILIEVYFEALSNKRNAKEILFYLSQKTKQIMEQKNETI